MNDEELIDLGLNGNGPIKVIMEGKIIAEANEKKAVVSIVFISLDKEKIKAKFYDLRQKEPDSYYMIYSCELDKDLNELFHYPSVAIEKEDLN